MTNQINSYIELGRQAFRQGTIEEAIQYLLQALELAKTDKHLASEQVAGELLCDFYAELSDQLSNSLQIPEATQYTLQCLEYAKYLSSTKEHVSVLVNYSLRLGRLHPDNYVDVRRLFLLRAKKLAQSLSDKVSLLNVLHSLTVLELSYDNIDTGFNYAMEMWDQSKDSFHSSTIIGDYARRSYRFQAEYQCRTGNIQNALELCKTGIAISKEVNDISSFFGFISIATDCESRLGNIEGAKKYYEDAYQATPIDQGMDNYLEVISSYGEFLIKVNQNDLALEAIQKILLLQKQHGSLLGLGRNFHTLAMAHYQSRDVELAISAEEQALKYYKLANFAKGVTASQLHLTAYRQHLRQSNNWSADRLSGRIQPIDLDQATMFKSSKLRALIGGKLLEREANRLIERWGQPIEQLEQHSTQPQVEIEDLLWKLTGNVNNISKLIVDNTSIHLISKSERLAIIQLIHDMLQHAQDIKEYKSVWEIPQIVSEETDQIAIRELLPEYVSNNQTAIRFITCAIIEAKYGDKAKFENYLSQAEGNKPSLRYQFAIQYFRGLYCEKIDDVEQSIMHYCRSMEMLDEQRVLASTAPSDRQRFTDMNIRIIQHALELLYLRQDVKLCLWVMEYFRSRSLLEKRISLENHNFMFNITNILKLVEGKKLAIMSFYQTEKATYLVVANSIKNEIFQFKHKDNNIPILINRFVSSLQPISPLDQWLSSGIDWSAKELFEVLLEPWFLAAEEEIKKLIVAPHGELAKLPLGALPHLHKPHVYMIDTVPIVYTPNLSLLYSETPTDTEQTTSRLLAVGVKEFSNDLPSLPGAHEEIRAIANLFEAPIIITDENGKEVQQDNILERLKDVTIAHFATHGEAITDQPFNAWLWLTNSNKLEAQKLLELNSSPLIVTLGVCKSSLGYSSPSEGMQGLAYAFMIAGTSNIVSTLWSMVDEVSVTFFTTFYQNYLKGENLSQALYCAIKSIREMTIEALPQGYVCDHPYFWAPFTLYSTYLTI